MEGLDEMLTVSKIGWVKKSMALRMAKYFIPRLTISNDDTSFRFVIQDPLRTVTKNYIVDGPQFSSTFGPWETPGTGRAYWDGDVFVLETETAAESTMNRKWLENGQLIEEATLYKDGASATLRGVYRRVR